MRAVRRAVSASTMPPVLSQPKALSAAARRRYPRRPAPHGMGAADAHADRHAGPALPPVGARSRAPALAHPPPCDPGHAADPRVGRLLRRLVLRLAVHDVRADDRRAHAVLRRRARPAAPRRRALEQPPVATSAARRPAGPRASASP